MPISKPKKGFKLDSDEELSPTSSVDSSENEDDQKKIIKEPEIKVEENVPSNSSKDEIKTEKTEESKETKQNLADKSNPKGKPKVKTIIVKKIDASKIKNNPLLLKVKDGKNIKFIKAPVKLSGTPTKKIKLTPKANT